MEQSMWADPPAEETKPKPAAAAAAAAVAEPELKEARVTSVEPYLLDC